MLPISDAHSDGLDETTDTDEEALRHLERQLDTDSPSDDDSADPNDDIRDEEFRSRPPDDRVTAVERIRTFRADPSLALMYRCTAPNPYKDDDAKLVEIYADDRGNEYWIDPADDLLVQAGPSARLHPTPRKTRAEDRLTVPELRAKALAIVEANVEGFAKRRSTYHPLEDNRNRETYFFRWDDFSQPAKESELPPFVQVGLHADGTVASYTNTLNR